MEYKEQLRVQLHKMVDAFVDEGQYPAVNQVVQDPAPQDQSEAEPPKRELPEGKRVVRTKSSGDRVYLLDEEKKTRSWITNPDVLKSLGFEIEDVAEVDDSTLLKYQMSSALYKVDGQA